MKALVTEPNSFVGSALIEELDTLGFEVRVLVRKNSSKGKSGLAPKLASKFERVEGDVRDFDSLCRAVQNVDYIFHLAEMTQALHPSAYFEYNSGGTERLARAAVLMRPHLSRFVYVSSLAAGGPSHSLKPKLETEKDEPISNYGKSKLQGEKELLKYRPEMPISIVRPSLVYGPKDKLGFLFVRTVARNFMPILRGSNAGGHKYFSAIHAKDLCRGIVQAAVVSKKKVASGEVFYLTGDGVHTYQEFIAAIAEKLNCDPLKVRIPNVVLKTASAGLSAMGLFTGKPFPLNWDRIKEVLPDYWICSNQKAKKILGFVPEFDLATGLAQSIEWYKRQKWI